MIFPDREDLVIIEGTVDETIDYTMGFTATFVYDPDLIHWHKVDCSLRETLTTHEIQHEKCLRMVGLEAFQEELEKLVEMVSRDGGWRGSKEYEPLSSHLSEVA